MSPGPALLTAILAAAFAASEAPVPQETGLPERRTYVPDTTRVRLFDPALEPRKPPYVARYGDGASRLDFVAARHGKNEATFALIRREFALLAPVVVVVEGIDTGASPPPELVGELADESEPFYTVRLAWDKGVRVVGGEPSPEALLQGVLDRGFSVQDFEGFYVIRTLTDGRHGIPSGELVEKVVAGFRREFHVEDEAELFTEESFKAWYRARNGKELEYRALKPEEVYPREGERLFTRRVAAATSMVRNVHLSKVIAEALSDCRGRVCGRVLVVYGAGHHVELAPVLEGLLGPPKISH